MEILQLKNTKTKVKTNNEWNKQQNDRKKNQ